MVYVCCIRWASRRFALPHCLGTSSVRDGIRISSTSSSLNTTSNATSPRNSSTSSRFGSTDQSFLWPFFRGQPCSYGQFSVAPLEQWVRKALHTWWLTSWLGRSFALGFFPFHNLSCPATYFLRFRRLLS